MFNPWLNCTLRHETPGKFGVFAQIPNTLEDFCRANRRVQSRCVAYAGSFGMRWNPGRGRNHGNAWVETYPHPPWVHQVSLQSSMLQWTCSHASWKGGRLKRRLKMYTLRGQQPKSSSPSEAPMCLGQSLALRCILPTYLATHLPTHLPTYLPTYLPTHLPTYLPTHLPTYLPTYPPTYLPI